jgi:asparagine synthase (glutamine-hydrolysing)
MLRQYKPLLQSFFREGLFDPMDERYFRLISRIEDAETLVSRDVWGPKSRDRMFGAFGQVFNNPSTKSYFNKMTNFDLKTLLPALLHVEDRTSMSVSLESRVPLLDHRVAELVSRMPPAMRFKGGDSKRIFRETVQPFIPDVVFSRRDKMGFPVPLNEWLRGPIRDFVHDVLLSDRARHRGIYQMAGVERLLTTEQSFGRQLWGLLSLELWFRAFVDGERLPPGRAREAGSVAIAH